MNPFPKATALKRHPGRCNIVTTLLLLVTSYYTTYPCSCQTYQDTYSIIQDKLVNANYSPAVIPVLNQSQAIEVEVMFSPLGITEVNEVTQTFTCNGVATFIWRDQMLKWNPDVYGGKKEFNPQTKQIWKPKMFMINTMGEQNLFKDEESPLIVFYSGIVLWMPGSTFPVACRLDMTKYPFDQQECSMTFFPMAMFIKDLIFKPQRRKGITKYFQPNGEWNLLDVIISTGAVLDNGVLTSFFQVTFYIKRRPAFLVLNILLPVVVLSALNLLVFAIPVESGEKIGYGITVLLALSVYLSIISGMLPRSSDTIPYVSIYLCTLFLISVMTVSAAIVIEYLHHMEERKESRIKVEDECKKLRRKLFLVKQAVKPLDSDGDDTQYYNQTDPRKSDLDFENWKPDMPGDKEKKLVNMKGALQYRNCYKIAGKYLDKVFFSVFSLMWVAVTIWFFIHTTM